MSTISSETIAHALCPLAVQWSFCRQRIQKKIRDSSSYCSRDHPEVLLRRWIYWQSPTCPSHLSAQVRQGGWVLCQGTILGMSIVDTQWVFLFIRLVMWAFTRCKWFEIDQFVRQDARLVVAKRLTVQRPFGIRSGYRPDPCVFRP